VGRSEDLRHFSAGAANPPPTIVGRSEDLHHFSAGAANPPPTIVGKSEDLRHFSVGAANPPPTIVVQDFSPAVCVERAIAGFLWAPDSRVTGAGDWR
jgi:hypothetical protein